MQWCYYVFILHDQNAKTNYYIIILFLQNTCGGVLLYSYNSVVINLFLVVDLVQISLLILR